MHSTRCVKQPLRLRPFRTAAVLAGVSLGFFSAAALAQQGLITNGAAAVKKAESFSVQAFWGATVGDLQGNEERDELQAALCETRSRDPNVVGLAIRNKLPRVGGWFSVRALVMAADDDATFERNLKRHHGDDDLSFALPSDMVLRVLPEVLPKADLPKYRGGTDAERAKLLQDWKQWISNHETELKTMRPTGSEVDFSARACKNGKPRRSVTEGKRGKTGRNLA